MATYATYRHVELDRVGLGKKRVLKPPGGGSSISFGEEEDYMKPQPKPTPVPEAPKEESNEQTPKVETNGTDTPQKDNDAATKENLSTATNGSTNSGSSTPTHSKLDTQSRLFGEQQPREVQGRKVRDHQRSNIFGAEEDVRANGTANGSPRAAGNPVPDTPESKTPDQQQPQQKQRIPPGGFSTKLW